MKNIYSLLFIAALFLVGCDDYLNRQPDEQLTSDTIWEKRESTTAYLYNVYSFLPNESELVGNHLDHYASDETSCSFSGRVFGYYWRGQYTPDLVDGMYYSQMYQGIHEANVFLANVDRCPDSEINQATKAIYKAEARFLRAYYYYRLMKNLGPVFWAGELDTEINTAERVPWQTLVDYVCSELDEIAPTLPTHADRSETEQGRPTQGAALALKARLLLYSARPLFNGQNGTHIYDNIKTSDGKQLFNIEYDQKRWEEAAAAALAVINLGHYSLVNDSARADDFERGLENLTNLYVDQLSNDELIYTYQSIGNGWRHRTTPSAILDKETWGVYSPTQKVVDAFAMATGVYPVKTEYWDTEAYAQGLNVRPSTPSQVDKKANYKESGSVNMKSPLLALVVPDKAVEKPTMNQFVGREARFYRNIVWSGMQWYAGSANIKHDTGFHSKGEDHVGQNYTTTGYLAAKWYAPKLNPIDDWNMGFISFPIFRLGGVYLDYVEALNECDGDVQEMLTYWNAVRNRAGVPNIEDVYPAVLTDKDLRRLYIRRERMVEMCFENVRWTDTRTWMTATVSNSGYVVGCNLRATDDVVDGPYWERREIGKIEYGYGECGLFEPRVFTEKMYLLPFPTSEVNRVPALWTSQNYGW